MLSAIAIGIVLAGAAFKTPLPVPDLVQGTSDQVWAAVGEPRRVIKGEEAKKICGDACDELRVYGPETAAPEVTTASAFVYLTANKVQSVKWIFPGKLAKPDSYPVFKKVFEGGGVPVDLDELESHDPITVDGVTDATRRVVTWRRNGFVWTAIVLTPLVREFEGASRMGLRKALPEEWRVVLIEAGPRRYERAVTKCDPTGATPWEFDVGETTPERLKEYPVWSSEDARGDLDTKIVLDVTVNAEGTVRSALVLRGPPALGTNAVLSMKRWKFAPHLCEGTPIPWRARFLFEKTAKPQ